MVSALLLEAVGFPGKLDVHCTSVDVNHSIPQIIGFAAKVQNSAKILMVAGGLVSLVLIFLIQLPFDLLTPLKNPLESMVYKP